MMVAQDSVGNWLLRSLDPDVFAIVQPHLVRVPVRNGEQIATCGHPIASLCFPEAGVAGFVHMLGNGHGLAVGLLGREGFVGWPLLMGNARWGHDVVARGKDATALRIGADRLKDALAASAPFRDLLLRYTSTFVTQLSQTIVSNLIHPVEQRLARWLLLYHDRLDTDELAITHDELGVMLGVRRASITAALHQLEGEGLIRGYRGRVLIRDRAGLVGLTAETYGQAEAEYRRLIGPLEGTNLPQG